MIREVRDWASKWIIHLLHFLCCLIGLTKDIHNHELHTSISKSPSFFFQYWIYFFQETHSTRKLQTQQGCGYVVRVRMTSAQYSYGGRWAMWQCIRVGRAVWLRRLRTVYKGGFTAASFQSVMRLPWARLYAGKMCHDTSIAMLIWYFFLSWQLFLLR